MKKSVTFVLIAAMAVCFFSFQAIAVESRNVVAQNIEQQLTKKEERKLKRQQKKEEKDLREQQKKNENSKSEEKVEKVEVVPEQQEKDEGNTPENNSITNGHENVENNAGSSREKNEQETSVEKGSPSTPLTGQNERKSSENSEQSDQKPQEIKKQASKPSKPLSVKEKTIIFLVLYGIMCIWIVIYRYKRICGNCSKWNAMKKVGGWKVYDEKRTVIKETREKKDAKGKIIQTWEVGVPATTYYYRHLRKCKHCGYEDYIFSKETRKN